jgi:hypothetical protein
MWKQDRTARTTDTSFPPESDNAAESRATGGRDNVAPIGQAVRPWFSRPSSPPTTGTLTGC